jgi:glycosyltransferase involved in cell wall biosynthesis
MKVLLIAPLPPPAGGIQSVTENLLGYVKNNPDGINLIHYDSAHRFRTSTSEAVFIRLITGITNSIKTYLNVLSIIKRDRPDVIHLDSSSSLALIKDYLIVKAAKRHKTPVVIHWHFGRIPALTRKKNWEWKVLHDVIQKSTVSIVIDDKSFETLLHTGINNIVNIPNPLPHDVECKAKFIHNTGRRIQNRIIFVGHIIKSKGVYELVEACAWIPEIHELVLIGSYEDSVKQKLISISKSGNNEMALIFTGQLKIDEVLEYMGTSQILALPSYTEGFPMVIIEAMAMGCAVIATNVGAIPEILAIGTPTPCGICVPPRNVEKLRNAISKLTNNQNDVEVFGKRGNDRVLNSYTMEKIYTQYMSVWKTALSTENKAVNNYS